MKFAKVIFWCAGVWGVLVLTPMYFMYGKVDKYSPPAPTHPEFYYGFVGVTLAWQVTFLVIATDPARFRPIIVPSLLEKLGYVVAMTVLSLQDRITALQFSTAVPDALLGALFVIAFFKTRPSAQSKSKESKIFGGVQ